MAGKDMVWMSLKEIKRLKTVQSAIDKQTTQRTAGLMLGLSERQIRRLVKAVKQKGDVGIIHRSRGRPSPRRFTDEIRQRVVSLYSEKYPDFGPTLAAEKLLELDGIKISAETLRKWLLEAGLWQKRRKRSLHRRWRQRKECFGEMVQMDGSHHDWLEGRGPELVLMGYIDDATGAVYGRFYDYEGTLPAMDSFGRYVQMNGLPISVYLDRHTTYKSPKKLTDWEKAEGVEEPLSQFERALKELGVEVIHALSPQAKGRIERLFGVLQDRLIKEMRLRGIKTKDAANEFLEEYLPCYNEKFQVCPAHEADAHVKLPKDFNVDKYLCIKTERSIRNDNTLAHNGKLYQIEEPGAKKVIVEEKTDGSMHIMSKGKSLQYHEITERPTKETTVKADQRIYNRPRKPSQDHPWKKRWKNWKPAKAAHSLQQL